MTDDRTDGRIDLSPLAARDDAVRLETAVLAIVRDGVAARRRNVYLVLDRWRGPALVAAALIIAALIPAMLRRPRSEALGTPSTAEVLGVPVALVDLVASTPQPSPDDVVRALNMESRATGRADVR